MPDRGPVPGTRHPLGEYDWSRAPQEPYHPRPDDYQVPGDGHALPILEVPNWTYPVGALRQLEHQVRGRSWRDFANPAKTPTLVGKAFRRPPYTVPFVCYFHPEELLSPSWMFGSKHVAQNLASLLVACAAQGLHSPFVVASLLFGAAGGGIRVPRETLYSFVLFLLGLEPHARDALTAHAPGVE